MRRRNVSSEEKGERIQVSLKLPKEILDRIDESWKSGEIYTGRSHYIEEACRYYLECEPCPKCGHLNSHKSRVCSVCENKLKPYYAILDDLREEVKIWDDIHMEIVRLKDEYDDLKSKLKWLVSKLNPENETLINEVTEIYLESINKSMNTVNSYFEYYDFYSTQEPPITDFTDLIEEKYQKKYQKKFDSVMDMISFNTEFRDVTYACMHYYYRFAKLVLADPSRVTYWREISDLQVNLATERMGMKVTLLDMSLGLENLRSVEKMIDVLNKNTA